MRKIAVFNKKGGVGKSTISVQLAHGLTKYGHKVLLFDLDSQKNCGLYLGIKEHKYGFDDVIDKKHPIPLKKAIYPAREDLYLLSNGDYSVIDNRARDYPRIDLFLRDKLEDLDETCYSFLIIDTSPSISPINNAVLCYVEELIVPIDLEEGSIRGLNELHNHLDRLDQPRSMIKWIVPNKYRHTNLHKEYYSKIKEIIGSKVVKPINNRIKIAEATSKGNTIFESDKIKEQFTDLIRRVHDEST